MARRLKPGQAAASRGPEDRGVAPRRPHPGLGSRRSSRGAAGGRRGRDANLERPRGSGRLSKDLLTFIEMNLMTASIYYLLAGFSGRPMESVALAARLEGRLLALEDEISRLRAALEALR